MATVTVSFTYDDENHKRLHRWLKNLPKRGKSEAIREALVAHLGQSDITHRDILEAIQELGRHGIIAAAQDGNESQSDVPVDILENLDSLGL